ncbi:biofilm-associated surface protein [Vibrio sp. JCM 19236]|nr:biofilm-associated surface protein [Vibrio sp. JCM 19236]
MKKSKVALAVALSAGLLAGCDFDVGPENTSSGGDGGGSTTSDLVGAYWDFGTPAAAATQSVDLPNVYVFDGTTQKYYDDDATPGIYEIKTAPYTDDIEGGVITFTYYDENGAGTEVTGTYTVVDGVLTVDSSSFGTLTAADETTNEAIKDAVEKANADAGFNNLVQILDTLDDDTGELRLKLADSATDVPVDSIAKGKITVDLTYQKHADTEQAEDDSGNNAYLTLYTDGTGNAELYGEAVFNNGEIFYRTNTIEGGKPQLSDKIGEYNLGEELAVELSWGDDEYSFKVNDTVYGPFPYAAKNLPVEVIAIKMGDNSNTTHFELLADNFKVYNIEGANEELVFEDNFDGYAIGQNLSGNPYNNNSSEAMVVSATGEEPAPEPDPEPTPEPEPGEYTDDFDSYTVGTQIDVANSAYVLKNIDGSETLATVSDDFAKSGANSLYIADNSASTKGVVAREFSAGAANSGSVSTSVYIPTDGYNKASYLFLGTDTGASSSKRFTEVIFTSSVIKVRDFEGNQQELVSYSKDTWVDVDIAWNGTDITVTVDGTEFTGLVAENDTGAPTAFALYNGDNSSVGTYTYFDNLDSDLF